MKDIYILSSCNEWKKYDSMRLVAASTSLGRIKSAIIQKIKDGDIEYKRGFDKLPKTKQIKMLRNDWDKEGYNFVFENLDYGYVEIVADGEIQ